MLKLEKMKLINRINMMFFILLISLVSGCAEGWPELNYKQFDNPEIIELTKAVQSEDVNEIEQLVKIKKVSIDYQDPKNGNTLLKVAILTQKKSSIKKLLELGANPNIKNKLTDESPFLFACSNYSIGMTDIELIDLLIKNGANINSEQTYSHSNGSYFQTPLMLSVDVSETNPKDDLFYFLIEKGANINQFSSDSLGCVLWKTASYNRMDLLKFLIFQKKCIIPKIANIRDKGTKEEEKETLVKYLGDKKYEKGSKKYELRNEILEYLKIQGYN